MLRAYQQLNYRSDFTSATVRSQVLSPTRWDWERFTPDRHDGFWTGTSGDHGRWLFKMRTDLAAHREHTFEQLAQRLGLSCQRSAFVQLTSECPPLLGQPAANPWQIALRLLEEHEPVGCSSTCEIDVFRSALGNSNQDRAALVEQLTIADATDCIRADLLAILCGASERSDRLVTKTHQFVIIDNEQMFSTKPGDLRESPWLKTPGGRSSPVAARIAKALCAAFAAIGNSELATLSSLPEHVSVEADRRVAPFLRQARDAAANYLQMCSRDTQA